MGSELRRQRRAAARRETRAYPSRRRRSAWPIVVGAGALVAALGALTAVIALSSGPETPVAPAPGLPASPQALGAPIDGIGCNPVLHVRFHIHAHLTILVAGHGEIIPRGIGLDEGAGCVYWLHTHNDSGVIHVETPFKLVPLLGDFFDIWGEPLSRTRIGRFTAGPGQAMRVWVGRTLWTADPRLVRLRRHTTITIEIGPPFNPPRSYRFGRL